MTTRTRLVGVALVALGAMGCSDRVSTQDAAVDMDASVHDVGTDAASTPDVGHDANDHDVGNDVGPDVGTDAGPLDCASLPACADGKGCGPTLTEACCCGGTVFDPSVITVDCCCGYGIIPGDHLRCP